MCCGLAFCLCCAAARSVLAVRRILWSVALVSLEAIWSKHENICHRSQEYCYNCRNLKATPLRNPAIDYCSPSSEVTDYSRGSNHPCQGHVGSKLLFMLELPQRTRLLLNRELGNEKSCQKGHKSTFWIRFVAELLCGKISVTIVEMRQETRNRMLSSARSCAYIRTYSPV